MSNRTWSLPAPVPRPCADAGCHCQRNARVETTSRTTAISRRLIPTWVALGFRSLGKIAERLGVHQATVSRQIRRGLERLRTQLGPALREKAPAIQAPQKATSTSGQFFMNSATRSPGAMPRPASRTAITMSSPSAVAARSMRCGGSVCWTLGHSPPI